MLDMDALRRVTLCSRGQVSFKVRSAVLMRFDLNNPHESYAVRNLRKKEDVRSGYQWSEIVWRRPLGNIGTYTGVSRSEKTEPSIQCIDWVRIWDIRVPVFHPTGLI